MAHMEQIFKKPRPKKDIQKWTLGYDHYALISKYIYDPVSLYRFTRVCTRTSAPFNMLQNLSTNIVDYGDFPNIRTHVIYTDRNRGVSDFMAGVSRKMYFGTRQSFRAYFKGILCIKITLPTEDEEPGKIIHHPVIPVFATVHVPEPFIRLVVDFLNACPGLWTDNMIEADCNMHSTFERYIKKKIRYKCDTKAIMELYDSSPIKMSEQGDLDSCFLIFIKLDKIITSVVSSAVYMKNLVKADYITTLKREGKQLISIGGIEIPAQCIDITDRDFSYRIDPLMPIFNSADLWSSLNSCTPLCGLDMDMVEVMRRYAGNAFDSTKKLKKNEIAVFKLESYDGVFNVSEKGVHRDVFYVILLPRLQMNYFIANNLDRIEPINSMFSHVKGTHVVVGYMTYETGSDYAWLADNFEIARNFDTHYGANCGRRSGWNVKKDRRFVTGVDIYRMGMENKVVINGIITEIDEDMASTRKRMSVLYMKYGYFIGNDFVRCLQTGVDMRSVVRYTRELAERRGFTMRDIKTMAHDAAVMRQFVLYSDSCLIRADFPTEWLGRTFDDDAAYIQTPLGLLTYRQCKTSRDTRVTDILIECMNMNEILFYLVTGRKKERYEKVDISVLQGGLPGRKSDDGECEKKDGGLLQ